MDNLSPRPCASWLVAILVVQESFYRGQLLFLAVRAIKFFGGLVRAFVGESHLGWLGLHSLSGQSSVLVWSRLYMISVV